MGREILLKIFDGPQNICSYCHKYILIILIIILFFKLKGLEDKISKLAIKEI